MAARPELVRRTGDARELCLNHDWSRTLGCVVTDPPYPTLERHRAVGTTTRLQTHTFETTSHADIVGTIGELGARIIPGGYALVMCDIWSWMHMARIDGVDANDTKRSARAPRGKVTGLWWRHPWTWVKTTLDGSHAYGGTGYHGRTATEMIALLQKPAKRSIPILKSRLSTVLNVFEAPRVRHPSAYPTQKPQKLGRHLIDTFSVPGLPVLDPFAGSGRWLIDAAQNAGIDLELWDLDEKTAGITTSGDWP